MVMEQRISLVTLGVDDLARSTAFFERLGWRRSVGQAEGISFFQCGTIAISLYPRPALAEDAGVTAGPVNSGGFAIAYNARSKEDVDAVLAEVDAAGWNITKPAADAFWGGYSGYLQDIDGHLWEVAWNPHFPLDEMGGICLPD